jgi:hypothetical protein
MEKKEEKQKRIKIEDLPADLQVSEEDLMKVQGGSFSSIVGKIWATLGGGGGGDDDGGSGVCGVRG